MSSISPTNSAASYGALRLAQAYGGARSPAHASATPTADRAASVRDVASVRPSANAEAVGRIQPAPSHSSSGSLRNLVAGLVPGRIDFSGDEPVPTRPEAMPIYRHPADKNAAATGVHAGRLIDTEA
ncbi:MAG: hypothetical protein EA378_03475 [Phycisphaerales bacterium]|nr:MAG: hypothetical protein EA378_03475 [Phycisphaerales bacterium]